MSPERENRLEVALRRGSRRLEERPLSEVSGRTRVSCDLSRENYLRLHMTVGELGVSKIAVLNALVALLADQDVRGRVCTELARHG